MRFAVCQSHRAREKLKKALYRNTQCYFTMQRHYLRCKGIIAIKSSEVDLARNVKGITVMSEKKAKTINLFKCW